MTLFGNMPWRVDDEMGTEEEFGYNELNRLVSMPRGEISHDGKGNITALPGAGDYSIIIYLK